MGGVDRLLQIVVNIAVTSRKWPRINPIFFSLIKTWLVLSANAKRKKKLHSFFVNSTIFVLISVISGDIKMSWLQPPYSAANLYRKSCIVVEFWIQQAVTNFDVLPKGC